MRTVVAIETPRPLEDVFAFVAREYFEHHRQWDPDVVELEKLTTGPIRAGTEGRELRRVFGRTQEIRFRISHYEPPYEMVLEDNPELFQLTRRYRFETTASGTRVTFTFDLRAATLAGRVLLPVVGLVSRRIVQRNIGTRLHELLRPQ